MTATADRHVVDGRAVLLRPLDPQGDRDRVRDALERLSPTSRYLRFGTPKPRFAARDVAWMLDVDHRRREAVVAIDPDLDRIVGAMHVVVLGGGVADVAAFVADDWQGRGVGRVLLEAIAAWAAAAGVRVLRADVLAENARAVRALRRAGFARVRGGGSLVAFERSAAPEPPVTPPCARSGGGRRGGYGLPHVRPRHGRR